MEAYITLLTNNNYASGALVLGYSLRASQTTKQLAVLITAAVSRAIRDRLAQVYDSVIEIGEIDSYSIANLQLLGRPELGVTFTKIHVFNQTQYSKVVFLDADTLVLGNIDELFDFAATGSLDDQDRNTRFAAAPDAGWPDCFNSGVFVCRPKYEDYAGLIQMASQQGTFDGGDQGLLNSYFDGWSRGNTSNRLPFLYNTTPTPVYSYAPALQHYKDRLKVIHFIGAFKPWQWLRFADGTVFPRNTSSKDSIDLVQQWWNVFDKFVGGKPSDIHEVTHGYDLPPQSQWDRIGMDRQVHKAETEQRPHYDGWFQPYTHQGQALPPPPPPVHQEHHQHHHEEHHHEHPQRHHDGHGHEHQQPHNEHHEHHHEHHEHHHEHHEHHEHQHHEHQHHEHQEEQHQEEHQHHESHDHQHPVGGGGGAPPVHHEPHREEQWQPPIPPIAPEHHHHGDSHHHTHHHEHHEHQHHHHETHYPYNPHHLTDYHYQPPPPPPKVPEIPPPPPDRVDLNGHADVVDRSQSHHHSQRSQVSDQGTNPHHLTDYRFRLPLAAGGTAAAGGAAVALSGIIPERVGLPDMYYTNAWDLPEDPRRVYPQLKPTPLVIENTTNDDNTTVPSGKGRPVFPWESGTTLASRKPTRTYYNYAATHEERRRQAELEAARRLQEEQEAMEQIRRQEQARYERERKKEEIREQMTGTQGFENFKLVNAWDVDPGVQWSIMKKTEQRRPRSRKSSAGGFRKGYGIEDMLAYEARQRQELYEAEIVRKRLEEEETRQREEARSKAEAIRLERLRQAKLEEEQRQRQVEGGSPYVFRNAWDPPHMALTKKKLRIEDEEVELALPLRQDRRSTLDISRSGSAGTASHSSTRVSTTERTGRGNSTVSAAAAGAVGVAIAAGSRAGRVHRDRDTSEDTTIEVIQQGSKSEVRSGQASVATAQCQSVASANQSQALVVQDTRGSSQSAVTTTTAATIASGSSSSLNTVKMTTPGSQRFVRTTVRTTITHIKYVNGVEVSSDTSTTTASDEKRFEIPPGPRSGSYFGEANRRTVTTRSSREASRLGVESTSSGSTHAAQHVITSGQAIETGASGAHLSGSLSTDGSVVSTLRKVGERTTTSTTTTSSRSGGEVTKSTSSDITSIGSTSEIGSRKFGEVLQIDTSSRTLGRGEEEEQTRRLDLREENATEVATAEAMRVLSKYPQATSRYGARSLTTSSTGSTSSKAVVGDVLYASDPNLPRQSIVTSLTRDSKGKTPKVQAVRAGTASDEEDEFIYEEEDLDELEYFGERHTRAALPVDSPYMPSTPLPYGYRYSGSAVSGYSSRTGSRPTTPGPGTPSRFGPSTPKSIPKKPFVFDLKHPEKIGSHSTSSTPPSGYQSAPVDSGFSNYRIEWNLKELLGKKPRHWTATEGEEYYDPYNALSTHGSQVDSDEDGGMLESSTDDSSDEEEGLPVQRAKTASSSGSKGASSFATGDDNEFTRESEFVIRGGKIARRRSSVVLERREL